MLINSNFGQNLTKIMSTLHVEKHTFLGYLRCNLLNVCWGKTRFKTVTRNYILCSVYFSCKVTVFDMIKHKGRHVYVTKLVSSLINSGLPNTLDKY